MKDNLHITDKKSRLKIKLSHTPEKPGVYLHKNEKNEIIYVGKAKNLKNRLKNYFLSKTGHSHKTLSLIDNIYDFDIILTKNEYESILTENNFIKHHKPRYNVLLKDSKTYPYLKINTKEKWPQLSFTRKKKSDGALYFGPYPNVNELDKILNVIHKFFPLVRCSKHTFKSIARPCNYYHIQQCLAPCHLEVDRNEYLKIVSHVISILKGKTRDIISKLKIEMKDASADLNFEKAAKIRDSIKALKGIGEETSIDLKQNLDIDLIHFLCTKEYFVFYVSYIRDGLFVGANSYSDRILDDLIEPSDMLCSFLFQFYENHIPAKKIFVNDSESLISSKALESIEKFLCEKTEEKHSLYFSTVELLAGCKRPKTAQKTLDHLLWLSQQNAFHKLEDKIKIESQNSEKLLEIKALLKLHRLPRNIECYDISTFQGAATVGSRVVFKDGVPCKSLYRRYIIKDYTGKVDDFAGLKEVLRRRLKDSNRDDIDLLMVDGGTPQVREVSYLLKSLALEHIPFIGIAKQRVLNKFFDKKVNSSQERVVIPARGNENELLPKKAPHIIELDPHSKAFQVLVSLRDEAHRFAITFHRKRRDKLR